MKQGKALTISVVVTLLVSIGVIVFNDTYASNDTGQAPAATTPAEPSLKDRLIQADDEGSVAPAPQSGNDVWNNEHEGDEEADDEHEDKENDDDD
jgi:hypothetical protein